MIGVEGMAQAKRVGQGGWGDEGRMEAQDDGGSDPNSEVDGNEQSDDANAVGRDAVQELGLGREREVTSSCHDGVGRPFRTGVDV